MSYHLRLHGLIQRIPKTHHYRLTGFGLCKAVFWTRACTRILRHGFGMVLTTISPVPTPCGAGSTSSTNEIAAWVDQAKMVA